MISSRRKVPLRQFPRTAPSIATPFFILKSFANDLVYNRVAAIIGAKAVPSAVKRHFWKRRLYDIVDSWPDEGRDFVVIASAKINELPVEDLKNQLERARARLPK